VATLHDVTRGNANKLKSLLLSVLKDTRLRPHLMTAHPGSSESRTLTNIDSTIKQCSMCAMSQGVVNKSQNDKIVQNIIEVMAQHNGKRSAIAQTDVSQMRRTIVTASLPTTGENLGEFRKVLGYGKHVDVKALQAKRQAFFSHHSDVLVQNYKRGRIGWGMKPDNIRVVDALMPWLEEEAQSTIAPGKYSTIFRHRNLKGDTIRYHSGRNGSNSDRHCNHNCESHVKQYLNHTVPHLHKQFISDFPWAATLLSRQKRNATTILAET
jgi:hypothetical protein